MIRSFDIKIPQPPSAKKTQVELQDFADISMPPLTEEYLAMQQASAARLNKSTMGAARGSIRNGSGRCSRQPHVNSSALIAAAATIGAGPSATHPQESSADIDSNEDASGAAAEKEKLASDPKAGQKRPKIGTNKSSKKVKLASKKATVQVLVKKTQIKAGASSTAKRSAGKAAVSTSLVDEGTTLIGYNREAANFAHWVRENDQQGATVYHNADFPDDDRFAGDNHQLCALTCSDTCLQNTSLVHSKSMLLVLNCDFANGIQPHLQALSSELAKLLTFIEQASEENIVAFVGYGRGNELSMAGSLSQRQSKRRTAAMKEKRQ
jgi:hypothetical protein